MISLFPAPGRAINSRTSKLVLFILSYGNYLLGEIFWKNLLIAYYNVYITNGGNILSLWGAILQSNYLDIADAVAQNAAHSIND
jgi:hypothetical protein